jgi:hypothetical protein
MVQLLDTTVIDMASGIPSLGILLGSRVSSNVFEALNAYGHKSFFGAEFDTMRHELYNQTVRPLDQMDSDLSRTVNYLLNPDKIRSLTSIEDFMSIPPSMELAIALFAPVRQGIMEGRMEGFFYLPESLPKDDMYGRLIDNFSCVDVEEASDEDGRYSITGTMYCDDLDFSSDELRAIEETRDYILNKILRDTDRDPTSIGDMRG